jgi:hypothetical protein
MNITNLTTAQLSQILAIKEQIEELESQIESIAAGGGEIPAQAPQPGKRRRSAKVRAKMAAAQQARWARIKGTGGAESGVGRRKRKLSASHRRKLIKALAKARKIRWANAKAAGRGKRRISAAGRAAMRAAAKARWAKVKPARRDGRSSPEVRAKLSAAAKARWAKARLEGKTRL